MEFLKEMNDTKTTSTNTAAARTPRTAPPPYSTASGFRPLHTRAASTPLGGRRSQPGSPPRGGRTERSALLQRSYSTADVEGQGESMEYTGPGEVAGGTVMGIHNLAIVFPQFIVSARGRRKKRRTSGEG